MEAIGPYNLIIEASLIIIISFFFGEVAKRTNIPSVLLLIILGILVKFGMVAAGLGDLDFFPVLEVLGIVGLIMIVLEAALELELRADKMWPILKALVIALVGLLASTYAAVLILKYFIPEMSNLQAWLYATPLSILSSAIIIPSVNGLAMSKKEFHIYESTFSDILGIMMFYFLTGLIGENASASPVVGFATNTLVTIAISFIAGYIIIIGFQRIRSHTKLFLLISVLLLLYALGKKMHLSSLIIILVFGLMIANIKLFFRGWLAEFLIEEKAKEIYEGLHVITMETAFVVRTFFFVIFGITISLASLASLNVAMISLLILVSIYLLRFIILRIFIGADLLPQLYIAPRGLITILLFYAIPKEAQFADFEAGILLFIIIGTSLIMTGSLIHDKRKTTKAIREAQSPYVKKMKWEAPDVD